MQVDNHCRPPKQLVIVAQFSVSGVPAGPAARMRAVAAFEWMELQTLTSDIEVARSRLAAARADRDHRRMRALEHEIAAAERRRARLLSVLTDDLADAHQPPPPPGADPDTPSGANPDTPLGANSDTPLGANSDTPPGVNPDAPPAADHDAAGAPDIASPEGGNIVWEQLTPGDLERAEQEIAKRREEMLARHAEELKALEDDRDRITSLEQAIAEFMRKFGGASVTGEVVQLGDEREMRSLGRG
jgi:hypothetical protein